MNPRRSIKGEAMEVAASNKIIVGRVTFVSKQELERKYPVSTHHIVGGKVHM